MKESLTRISRAAMMGFAWAARLGAGRSRLPARLIVGEVGPSHTSGDRCTRVSSAERCLPGSLELHRAAAGSMNCRRTEPLRGAR